MYGNPVFTGRKRAPVKVVRLSPGGGPLTVTLGRLKRGMYAVRVVGAIESEPQDWTGDPKRLLIRCTVNDGPGGRKRTWIRRHRAVDEFYAVGEWYFHATDDREFQAALALEADSQVSLLVHNVDLHDALAGCPEKVVKTKATLYPADARRAAQAYYARHGKLSRSWGPNVAIPRAKGLWQGKPLPPGERRKRDDVLWNIAPPELMNFQNLKRYGLFDQLKPDEDEAKKIGRWEPPFKTRYRANWDRPRSLVDRKGNLTYSMADYLAHKPLPGPYPHKDRGWGVYVPGKGYATPILSAMGSGDVQYKVLGHTEVGALPIEYFNRNNLHAARDAAFILARIAYTQPALITAMRRSIQQVTCRPAQCFGFNDIVTRRAFWRYPTGSMVRAARAYDLLFDFIKDNTELASAVGRHVRWVKTPDDLRAFLDQRLLALPVREMIHFDMGSSHGTPAAAITLATIMHDRKATAPLMEHLFSSTWDYPLPLSGVQDYLVTGTTRDGTTSIGSFFYTVGGSPFLRVADMMNTYIRNGGDRKYNLADLRRYPKPFFGAYFNLDARVAGTWYLGVGDVGGPVGRRHHWFEGQEQAVRTGWEHFRDPRLAWILKNHFGRKDETDKQWARIEKAAAGQRDPWMANRSRALSAWAGILESGTEHDDYRFRRAATVRVGVGWGHSHRDTLDLQVFAMGLRMSTDGGQRPGYGRPDCTYTMNHNRVEVDGDGGAAGNWEGHAWIRSVADMPGSPMLHAKAVPPTDKAQARLAERTVALVDVDEGRPATKFPSAVPAGPGTTHDKDIALPSSYVFDVYRVAGGKRHTYCFHGCPDDEFTVNARSRRKLPPYDREKHDDDRDVRYLRKFVLDGYQHAGDAPETVVATWRLGRDPWTF
ncbi:MAG: hypothetical protein ACYS5V_11010, partial [Planctomycetota bacterium]